MHQFFFYLNKKKLSLFTYITKRKLILILKPHNEITKFLIYKLIAGAFTSL